MKDISSTMVRHSAQFSIYKCQTLCLKTRPEVVMEVHQAMWSCGA